VGVVRRVASAGALVVAVAFAVADWEFAPLLWLGAVVVGIGALAVIRVLAPIRRHQSAPLGRRPYKLFMLTQYGAHAVVLATAAATLLAA
jgi:hypothetical protein